MKKLPWDLIVFTLGLALFGAGLGLAWLPLGLIGPGLVLMYISLAGGAREHKP